MPAGNPQGYVEPGNPASGPMPGDQAAPAPMDPQAAFEGAAESFAQFGEAVAASPNASEQDMADIQQIMALFQGIAERQMGGGQEPVPAQAALPAEGGLGGVPMGPQGAIPQR